MVRTSTCASAAFNRRTARLLDLSRPEAGEGIGTPQDTDIAQLTAETAAKFRPAAEHAGLRLIVDCPPLAEPVCVDREAWERIVSDLIFNALKFPSNGEIHVRTRAEHGQVCLTVQDTGTSLAFVRRLAHQLLARVHATRARIHVAAGGRRERHEHELHAVLNDLRAAQRRVAEAGDAERRRVERDLHDGAQQRLMAIRLEIGLVRELLDHDPRGAGQRLDELHHELDAAVEQLRELAHGLYPPLLASDGLYAALISVARHSAIPLTVQGTGMTRAPRPIESSVYFCCLEALANATKHAGPSASVSIALNMSDDALRFCVSDDGEGFDPAAVSPGYGLVNLRDRIDALGGEVDVTSAPGRGTTVEGRVPLV